MLIVSRYHDQAILTWTSPIERLQPLFDELDQKHPDMQITTTVGLSAHFLGAYIENKHGRLYTRVYHDPTAQPHVLPYVIGHPRLIYRKWFQWALIRAVRYCTSLVDFDEERLNIELTFLANGYSLAFVKSMIKHFFAKFFAVTLEFSLDCRAYESLRARLIRSIEHEKTEHKRQRSLELKHQITHFSYLYDWGARYQFNEQFKKLWYDSFRNEQIAEKLNIEIDSNAIHCYSLNALLAHQEPTWNHH
jgi:hypothetical protein